MELAVPVSVQAALHDVHAPADPPRRPWLAFGEIHDLVVVAEERDVDVLDRGIPEPLDVGVGPMQQLLEGGDVMSLHEALEPALRNHVGARLPDHIADDDRLHRLWILVSAYILPTLGP